MCCHQRLWGINIFSNICYGFQWMKYPAIIIIETYLEQLWFFLFFLICALYIYIYMCIIRFIYINIYIYVCVVLTTLATFYFQVYQGEIINGVAFLYWNIKPWSIHYNWYDLNMYSQGFRKSIWYYKLLHFSMTLHELRSTQSFN